MLRRLPREAEAPSSHRRALAQQTAAAHGAGPVGTGRSLWAGLGLAPPRSAEPALPPAPGTSLLPPLSGDSGGEGRPPARDAGRRGEGLGTGPPHLLLGGEKPIPVAMEEEEAIPTHLWKGGAQLPP